ncbi:hypothetical protein Syun_012239 [Stephania yunnanensis]|uniref:Uncharacterized protein n=1 Tax=Stephania yunnanensis TaxID=152371 RepID=A0AAP0PHC0_9MAGN
MEKTKSQRNRSPTKSVFTATFIAPNQLFIFIAPNQLLIFTVTFIATYIPTISCLSDRLVSVSSLLSTLVSPSLAQPVALVTPSLSGHRPPNPQPPTNLSSRSLALKSLSLVFPYLARLVTQVSLVSLQSPPPKSPTLNKSSSHSFAPWLPVKMEFLNLIEKRTVFVYHAEGTGFEHFDLVQVEAKAAVDSVESSSPVPLAACAGHSLISWGNKLLSILWTYKRPFQTITVKAFDPLAYTWSILKTYGKAPVFDLPLLLKGKATNNFLSDKKGNSKEFL